MLWEIELLYFVAMIATFIVLLLVCKLPAGISLMVSAIVGLILGGIFSGTDISIRHLVEGGFGYFDTILIITCAMIFMVALEKSGAMEYISAFLIKKLYRYPTILLITFMLILMFPGMITGSSLASVVSAGALLGPIMVKLGIPKAKAAAIVAFGAIYGMIAPPINVPVMVICDVVDIPFVGFTLPLLALTVPLAIFTVLFLGRKYLNGVTGKEEMVINVEDAEVENATTEKPKKAKKGIKLEDLDGVVNFSILEELNWTVTIPIILLVLLIALQSIFPRIFGILATPLIFIISAIPCFFLGKKANIIYTFKDGVKKSLSAMALLMGVGMFVQVFTLTGTRGYFVINALSLPDIWQYVAIIIAVPVFGGISAFGSASILGGPFVMAMLGVNEIIVASALSLIAASGEFLPPTAMSATFAASTVEEKNYLKVTKAAIVPLIVTLVYAMLFIIVVAKYWN